MGNTFPCQILVRKLLQRLRERRGDDMPRPGAKGGLGVGVGGVVVVGSGGNVA